MRVCPHAEPASFRARAGAFLEAREAQFNLFFGLLSAIESGAYPEFWLATLEDDQGHVHGCALQTPPFPVVLSDLPPAALEALLTDRLAQRPQLEGVNGPRQTCRAFADAWSARTNATWTRAMAQGVFALDAVTPPAHPPAGHLRALREDDLDQVTAWIDAFYREADVMARAPAAARARERLAEGSLFLWDDAGQPTSMAAYAGPTPHGIRINSVYTPPPLRGRGYASATVAALSQRLLDEGRRFCFLFTDLDNPTSNKIYQALGYRKIDETVVLRFGSC